MKNNKKDKVRQDKEPKINQQNGLTIKYDKDQLNEKYPNLINEIAGRRKLIKINSVKASFNTVTFDSGRNNPEELVNPGAIDFIRRCTTSEEALNILDFLVKRKEISKSEYKSYKNQIISKDGLKLFINTHGGFKGPGYYEKKFRNLFHKKLNQNQRED